MLRDEGIPPEIVSITELGDQLYVKMRRYYQHPEYDNWCNRDDIPAYCVLVEGQQPDHSQPHELLCAKIRREFVNCKFDLHRDNLMVDHTGTTIITDPVSFQT